MLISVFTTFQNLAFTSNAVHLISRFISTCTPI